MSSTISLQNAADSGAVTRKILVVEDDSSLQKLILKLLNKKGYQAEGAASGQEAISCVENDPTLVLLLDLKLPDMSGTDIIDYLHARGNYPPFIVMTGQGDEKKAVEIMKLGAVDYLVKGLDLLDMIPEVLERLFNSLDTEAKLQSAENALRESEEKYRFLVENIEDVIWMLDKDLNTEYISPSVARILGYMPEEWKQKTFEERITPFSLHKVVERFKQSLESEKVKAHEPDLVYAGEVLYKHKNGSTVWMDNRVSVIRDKDGSVLKLYGVSRDITERKKADQQIHYMNFHDRLTGLYNRHYLEKEFRDIDSIDNLPLCIAMADLNGLKQVNDTYGHDKGDQMLVNVVEIMKNACRDQDIITRWGGDEFVIVMPQRSEEAARLVMREMSQECQNTFVDEVVLSMSYGVASKNDPGKLLRETLREAEDDMNRQKLIEARSTKNAVLQALLNILAEKSFETEVHTRRMMEVAKAIGSRINLPDSEINRLCLLITLHDIGKINMSEEILTKKGSLTDEEWQAVKKHPEIGFRIARATEEFAHVALEILAHHEKWDGSGYPQGLKGVDIPLLSRITAIADAYEIMSYGRPYKQVMTKEEIVAEFKKCAGTQFDPGLVDIFLQIIGQD